MSTEATTPADEIADAPVSPQEVVQSIPSIASAAKWFWWICGLSLVNTILMHSGSDVSFMMGLGFMLVADVLAIEAGVPALAFAVDAVVLGFFFAMGFFALRGHRWAFILGGVIYLLDGLIYLIFQDYLSVGFHGLALFYILGGFKQLNSTLKELRQSESEAVSPPEIPPIA